MIRSFFSLSRWRERAGERVAVPQAPTAITQILLIVLALVALAACGKKGSPVPPGPGNEIIFPKQYPSR